MEYYKQTVYQQITHLYEMDKFLERQKLLKLNQEKIESQSKPIKIRD